MHCNHRNFKNSGACKYCWRNGIVMWSIVALGLFIMYTFVPFSPQLSYEKLLVATISVPIIILGMCSFIWYSIKTKWKKGD